MAATRPQVKVGIDSAITFEQKHFSEFKQLKKPLNYHLNALVAFVHCSSAMKQLKQ